MKTVIRKSYTPKLGDYCNTLVVDKETGNQYIFDNDGVWTLISTDEEGIIAEAVAQANAYTDDVAEEKVDKEEGKGLSENDFTDALKDKLDGIEDGAQENVIETVKVNGAALTITDKTVDVLVPTDTSDLTNGAGFITADTDALTNYYTKNQTDDAIAAEAQARAGADNDLQEQIDAIASSSDVVDIVGTYAELQSYDTSKLHNNDIIKVLSDETRSGATTYYRWTTATSSFSYIGSQGPFYTKSESDSTFVPQTRTINGKALDANISLTAADVNALPASTVIPTVNDATLTIQKNGVDVTTFTANSATNTTANITVPTKTSDLTNDGADNTSTYVEADELATVATSGSYNDLTDKPTIDFELVEMSYGESNAWAKFIAAYQAKKIVYCRASSNSNPATGTQGRKAFMAYVNNAENPTEVEFQYVRSVSTKTSSQPVDQVFVYKLTNASGGTWTVQTRDMGPKLAQGTNTTVSYSNGTYTVSATQPTVNDATLTIKKNGTSVGTFTANASSSVDVDITVPTKTSDITNDSGYIDNTVSNLTNYYDQTTVNNMFNALTIPTKTSDLTNDSGFVTDTDYASANDAGVIKVGSGLSIDNSGVLSATGLQSVDWTDVTNKPTNVSYWTNDAGYITSAAVPTKTSDLTNDSGFITSASVPTKTSDLTNDSGFITSSVNNLANYYKKSETYTQGEVNSLLNAIVVPTKTSDLTNDGSDGTSTYVEADDLATVATSGSYNDLTNKPTIPAAQIQSDWEQSDNTKLDYIKNKPTIPTVNNATLTIQKNGTTVKTFTANASSNVTANITVPTKTSDLTNDSGFLATVAWGDVTGKPTFAAVATSGSYSDLSNTPTIPTKTSDLTNDSGFITSASIPTNVSAFSNDAGYLTSIPTASANTLGGIKVGAGLAISSGGVLSATGGGTADAVAWGHITGTMADQTDLTNALAAKADSSSLATVATSGSYNDLTNKPTIGNATLTIQKNGTSAGTFTANATSNQTINITVPTSAADVSALPASTKYGASIAVSINTTDYKVTTTLKDQDGNTLGTAQVIDLPLESVVVNGSYDSTNKKIVLTLQNGNTIDIPVADLVAGLQSEITAQNMLSSDLVDDTNHTHKFTTAADITKLAGIATGAEVNQNAFSNVKVGSTTVAADSKTDTLELVAGSNITLTPDATNDKVTIAATDTTYSDATTSAHGLMSAADKTKLNGIATGAEVNVQPDWSVTDTTSDAFIKNKPTIPTVNNATLTIQKNGTNVQTFTANQSTNATANITVPTKTSELTNDSGYTTNTGTITQVKLDGANVATSGVANVQAIPTVIGSSSVGGNAGDITSLKKYGSVNYNGSIIGTNILNLSVNRFYHCYERGATITCNYFSNPNEFCNGAYSKWDSSVNPSTAFTATPFVLEIKKTSSFEMTDVSRLLLIGHRLYGELMATKYKIEVAYAYSNNTYSWDTVIDYDGAAVDICQKFYGLYCSDQGSSSSPWHSIFGVRLTISGSTSTIFKLADVQLICGRGTEQPYESIHALSDAGGTVYGNVDITGSLKHNGYTYTLPNKTGTVAMTSDGVATATSSTYSQYLEGNGRISSADITHMYTNNDVHQRLDISSSTMTTGRPAGDGFINTYMWDNNGAWDTQLFIPNGNTSSNSSGGRPQIRFKNNNTWTTWEYLPLMSDVPTKTSDLNNDSGFITSIPTASASTLGGIKVGSGLSISNGVLSTQSTAPDWSDITNKPTFATVATSGSYNDLSNKPTIPTVNNATLTIQKNGTNVQTFTANASSNVTANITVPTTVAELSDASDYATTTDLADKQNLLSPGNHIDITSDVISATGYVHSENPQAAAAASSTITGSMIASGTITADKLATGATVQLTLSTSDIGEGSPLAANTLYGVYI